jgi:hypothetical protein
LGPTTPLEAASRSINTRRVTNLGTFRAYVTAYLRAHPLNQDADMMVRQLEPSATGLPLEVWRFSTDVSGSPTENHRRHLRPPLAVPGSGCACTSSRGNRLDGIRIRRWPRMP